MSRTVCDHLIEEGKFCEVCDALGKAQHAIHVKSILYEAWGRVADLPIIKSMHPSTRSTILRAIVGE